MFKSTKIIELGSCAFRQPTATSHCRFLHGYRLTAKFWFEAKTLDQNNWVVDFGGLKELKSVLQDQFDHTTCISRLDPKLDEFKRLEQAGVCDLRIMDGVGIEKFAEWCWSTANKHVVKITDGRCRCVKAEVFEHENNSAIFEKQVAWNDDTSDNTERKSTASGAQYMNDLADEIEQQFNETTNTKQNVTQPPFATRKPAEVGNKKSKGWIDPDSTNSWGL